MREPGSDGPLLFDMPPEFNGIPADGFTVFTLNHREARRAAILETIHPHLAKLGQDLEGRLNACSNLKFHAHLPRLDWPRGYNPFCTWLALSHESQGYQADAQLNVGVHSDYVAIRLGWDTSADRFGRFEFLCRVGTYGGELVDVAAEHGLVFRVYSAAPWPEGSRLVYESSSDIQQTFREVQRRGVWWELGRRLELADSREIIESPRLGALAAHLFQALVPCYERLVGEADAG